MASSHQPAGVGDTTASAAALAPAAVLALFAVWTGAWASGAGALANVVGALVLVGLAGGALARLPLPALVDPLALGRHARLLPWALLTVAVASWAASPVPRAGRTAILLLPCILLLPAALTPAFAGRGRRLALAGVALLVAGVATWALVGWRLGDPRPAAPLGHHNLLAAWLLPLLPLPAELALARANPRRLRTLGGAALGLGIVALLGTRSLAGLAGLATAAMVSGWNARRRSPDGSRWVLALTLTVALLGGAIAGPRLLALGAGRDPSLAARLAYWQAGLDGIAERPGLGWGPGATPWTLGLFLRPVPAVNPPSELVGDLHCLPLALAYELGLGGGLLATALLVLLALRPRPQPGLAGFAVAALGGAPLGVTALPVAVAVALAVRPPNPAAGAAAEGAGRPSRRPSDGWGRPAAALLAAIAVLGLQVDGWRAMRATELGTGLAPSQQRERLAAAHRLDPAFPLYPAQLANIQAPAGATTAGASAARLAQLAAMQAPGVATFWLLAGRIAAQHGDSAAGALLERACATDPLAAVPPFLRATLDADDPHAVDRAARSIGAEPRLLAATAWEELAALRLAAVARLVADEALDRGWRAALDDAMRLLKEEQEARSAVRPVATASGRSRSDETATASVGSPPTPPRPPSPTLQVGEGGVWRDHFPIARLEVVVDEEATRSLALHLFRRLPRPWTVAVVDLDARSLSLLAEVPAVTNLASTPRSWVDPAGCGLSPRRHTELTR